MGSFKKICNYINSKGGDKAKKVFSSKEILIIAILTGVILIIASTSMFSDNKKDTQAPSQASDNSNNSHIEKISESSLMNIKDVENIISKIVGAGKVSVMITYENGIEKVPGTDINTSETSTVENDAQGGNRDVLDTKEDKKIVYEDGVANSKQVFVAKEIQPKIKGVLIVSSGADDAEVKANISRSAQVLFNLPIHKIHVTEGIDF